MSTQHNMGFLILSEGGDGLGLAIRLREEGHNVSLYIKDPVAEQRGEGLCDKISSPDFTPTYIADCTGSGIIMDSYRDSGGNTFGGSKIADRLESDRKYANQIFRECGIRQPKSKEFHCWDVAKAFVESTETKLVFKPEGKFSGVLPSYAPHDNEELIEMFEQWKTIIGSNEPEFVLQEFIEGTCISSEAWVAKGQLLSPFNHTLERKQFLNGDLGSSGGCTGNVVWACSEDSCELCSNLHALEAFLKTCEYNGCIDINTVVTKEGDIYALEFTPRFGYDAFPTFLYGLFDGNFGGFVNDCCRSDSRELPLKNGFAAGVRVSLPPWPSEDFHAKAGVPIRGLRESNIDRFYPYEVNLQQDSFVTSGGWGVIGVAVGYGETIEEAFDEAYKLCKKLRLPDAQYRTDFVEVFEKDYKQIERALSVNV